MSVDERDVDLRVSVMPCTEGENVVVRVLDRASGTQRLAALGMPADHERVLREVASYSHGLFLVTGPTGSGKTTTLYAMLGEVDAKTRNVATIEDPVEVRMPLLRQSQVDPSVGFGFGEGLRSLLRQDPDVILVGEVRDHETADMALKAAMTGHLVFSTLHTNSALAAVPRLVDLGIDSYRIEDALVGVLGQRLVRRTCRACAERVVPDAADVAWLGGERPEFLVSGRGCARCGGSGFAGRTMIAELFLPDADTSAVIRAGASLARLGELAEARGFRTMTEDGRRLVRAGVTTRAEVERVNQSRAPEVRT
jgi:type II secretory ATPase GspE/PulE/Tfp pilus assembly ATPase PilB-like protein